MADDTLTFIPINDKLKALGVIKFARKSNIIDIGFKGGQTVVFDIDAKKVTNTRDNFEKEAKRYPGLSKSTISKVCLVLLDSTNNYLQYLLYSKAAADTPDGKSDREHSQITTTLSRNSAAVVTMRLAKKYCQDFFIDSLGQLHAAVKIDKHLEVLPIKSSRFKNWLCKIFYDFFAERNKQIRKKEECVPDIISAIQGWATITDVHAGFQRIDGRNLMGFNDEVSNPKPGDGIFDNIVFVDKGNEDAQFAGGTYMVFQKIEHNSDQWREFSLDKQQQWVGLSKGTGLLLGTLDEDEDQRLAVNLRSNNEDVRNEAAFDIKQLLKVQMNPETRFFDENGNTIEVQGKHKTYKIHPKNIRKKVPAWSHVRKSNPRREDGAPQITIFRRGYPFVETGLNNKIRSGLLFICFQKDIENGFEYITKRFLNNKNFPVPERRKFTEDELKERHKSGRFSVTELRHLTANERKVLGLDDEEFNKALKEAGVVNPDIDKDFTTSDIYKNDLDLVPDSQRTGREGLAGPSENGVIPDGEFLAIIPFGGGYYFVPPIPNKSTKDIGQQFFE